MAEGKGRVCVTGGTGFIASIIIRNLLQQGYSVNTTVRSGPANRKKDVSFLTNLPGATERLQIFTADLSNPESFGESIVGCVGVIHTATPVDFQVSEPPETVIKRSVDGAIGIVKACLDSKTVKRVVYTSSGSAVIHNRSGAEDMDESYWSDVDFLNETKQFSWSYGISKTLAEKAVLEFGEKNGLEVVSLIPPFVLGPFICAKLPDSVHTSLSLLFIQHPSMLPPWIGGIEYIQDTISHAQELCGHVESPADAVKILYDSVNKKQWALTATRVKNFSKSMIYGTPRSELTHPEAFFYWHGHNERGVSLLISAAFNLDWG